MEETLRIVLETVQRSKGELDTALKQIQKLTDGTKQQSSASERASAIIQKHRAGFVALGVAAAAAQAAVVLLLKSQIKFGDELNALSQKVGVSVETLSTLSKVAENANIEFGSFANGLKFFNKALTEAGKGGNDASQAFAALGFTQEQVVEGSKDSEKFLLQVSDAFSRYADNATKTTVASNIFGRDGFSWIPLLNKGSVGLKAEQAEIRALGGEMSGKFAKDADAFNDSLKNIGTIAKGVAVQILTTILPTLQKMAEFVIANRATLVPIFVALAGAISLATSAFVALKVASFAVGLGQLAALLPGLAAQFGLTATAVTATGAAAGATTLAFAPLLVAIVAVTAALATGVVAWQAYQASVGEEKAVASLGEQTSKITEFLNKQIEKAKEAGKITAEEARKLQIELRKGQAGGVDSQIAGNKKVSDSIRGKTTEEVKFNQAAIDSAAAIQKQADAKPSIVIPKTPKELSDAQLATTSGQAGAVGAQANLLENQAAIDGASETSERLAEIIQLRREEQSLQEFAVTEDLQAQFDQRLISQEVFESKKTEIKAQGDADRLALDKKALDNDALINRHRLQVAADTAGALVEIAEFFGEKGFIAAKAFAVAQATINTILSVTKALSDPLLVYPTNLVVAGVMAALGAVQVAKIAGVGFAEGGLVPGAPSSTDNRMAAVATGEYIFDANSVSKLGPAYFAGLHESIRSGSFTKGFARGGLVPRPVMGSSFASGGLVGGATAAQGISGGSDTQINLGFLDTRNRERDFMRGEGVRILIDAMQKRGNKVFA